MDSFLNTKPQKFVSRLDQRDYDVAISKLSYEIQHRKKEFLSLCTKHDPKYTSRILSSDFAAILNKFTVYPNEYEKKLIIYKSSIEEKYIDYISIAESRRTNEEPHQDIFLQHLNDERFKNYYQKKNNIVPGQHQTLEENRKNYDDESESEASNEFGLSPVDILNAEINEENFLRKVAKDLMTYILTHTKGERPKEFTQYLFKSFDFDNDDKYTIGELNNFLISCELVLSDSDLRFFYENFPVIDGKINISQINDFIEVNSEKNFESLAMVDQIGEDDQERMMNMMAKNTEEKFENQKKYQKQMEDERIIDMTNKSYITNTIKDCLLIFGRDYLMQYFGKYLFNYNNKPYIEDNSFILGLCSFGYKSPSSLEVGNFKYICIHKNIAHIRGLTNNIILNISGLFDFIIGFYEIGDTIKVRNSEELIDSMGDTYHDKINNSILSLVSEIKTPNISENEKDITKISNKTKMTVDYMNKNLNEKDFRKKFINSFGFIDHQFFNRELHKFCCEESKEGKDFNPNFINSKKFLEFSYNYLFLYMIKNYKSIGIFLDESNQQTLNDLYFKIKSNIFQKQKNGNNSQNVNYEENIFKTIPTESKSIKNTEGNVAPSEYNKRGVQFQDLNEKKDFMRNEFDSDMYGVNKYALNKKMYGSIKINDESQPITSRYKSIRPMNHIVNANPIEAIPLLYNICVKYLINKFKLERVSYNLLKGIGICKVFRDHLSSLKGGRKPKIHWVILVQNLENLVPEVVKNFLTQIAINNKDSDGNITTQFFFSKIEEILLQYNLSLDEEKNLAKYYV